MEHLTTQPRARSSRMRVVIGVALAVCAAAGVWFLGLDPVWAVATVVAIASVGALLATLRFEEDVPWEPPVGEPARGVRLVAATLETSLAACDRLARPAAWRRMRAFLIAEREDRLARTTTVRRMRAILVGALHRRGLDPANRSHDVAILALLGTDAVTILQPTEDNPVTSASIARCLDTIERLDNQTQGSP